MVTAPAEGKAKGEAKNDVQAHGQNRPHMFTTPQNSAKSQVFIKSSVDRAAVPPEVQRAETRTHATYANELKRVTMNEKASADHATTGSAEPGAGADVEKKCIK